MPKAPESAERGFSALRRILLAYATHNPGIGYCQVISKSQVVAQLTSGGSMGQTDDVVQGMNFLVGMLLQHLTEEQSFWGLAHIVEHVLADYFGESMAGVLADQQVCKDLLLQYYPSVMQHAECLQVNLALVASQWLLTAFVNVLPLETAKSLWDMMLFEGSASVLFRAMLTVVDSNVQALLTCKDTLDLWQKIVSIPGMFNEPSAMLGNAMIQYEDITKSAFPPTLMSPCILNHNSVLAAWSWN